MKKESFAKQVKEELCSNTYKDKATNDALLSAYIRINGTLIFRNKESIITLTSENAKIIKFIYQLLQDYNFLEAHLSYGSNNKKHRTYHIEIYPGAEQLLEELDISFLEGKISKRIVYDDNTIVGYLTGAFLACGSVNSPATSNYHLEFSLNSENYAKWLGHLFGRYKNSNIEPKVAKRRDKYILYFKKGDQIADFLIMINASSSAMDFETVRIDRDFTNNSNRLLNLDTANISKSMATAARQIKEIEYLESHSCLSGLNSKKIALVARIRVENPESSLEEIADIASSEINSVITKSNVNHIMRKIHDIYLNETTKQDREKTK